MPHDKESEKGIMHNFFGPELCEGCKGLLVVAFLTPSPRDISSFAAAFAKLPKDIDDAGQHLQQAVAADPNKRLGSSFKRTPSAPSRRRRGVKKTRKA
jgi:hypothetical protein